LDEEYARWSSIQGLSKDSIENLQNATQPGINLRISYKYEF
jgi:beta-xylosidase